MSLRPKEREEIRRSSHKATVSAAAGRRRREDGMVVLRKVHREEQLLKKRCEGLHRAAAAAVNTAAIEEPVPMMEEDSGWKLQSFSMMVNKIFSNDSSLQLEATTHFRNMLCIEGDPPIDKVVTSGVVPRFVEFLTREDYPKLQFEAAWALTNIAAGTSDNTRVVINHGAVPKFVELLCSSSNEDVREQAVWALGNVAGDSTESRDHVLECDALIPLLQNIHDDAKLSMLRNATWALSNIFRGKPSPGYDQVILALPVLARLIHSSDMEVLRDACWSLSYITDIDNDNIFAVLNAGVCRRVVELLMYQSMMVVVPALQTVGNIVSGDDVQTQEVIDSHVLPCLLHLLTNAKKNIKKEACWSVSNIMAGNEEQIEAVIQANIIGQLVQLMRNAESDIKKEAARAITNATWGGTNEHIKHMVNQGCIPCLCDLLASPDPKTVKVCLEALENILISGNAERSRGNTISDDYKQLVSEAGGVEKLEYLFQTNENNEIYDKAAAILETFWDVDVDDEDDWFDSDEQDASVPAGGFQFI